MKYALVVKVLTDQIILVRTDGGDLLSLSVSCRKFIAGTLLHIDTDSSLESGCVIVSADGRNCRDCCDENVLAVVIEHKDGIASSLAMNEDGERRNAI